MRTTEQLREFDGDANAPKSWAFVSIIDGEHGRNRAAYFIGGNYAELMYAPLDSNDYPVWEDATAVDKDLIEPWLAEIADRAELAVRTAEPCDECGTPAGQRSDDFNCQCNWW